MNLTIEWAGEELALLPERAVWWKRERTLFIADPHFGKASAFRAAGIPVPEAAHDADLLRLESVLTNTAAARLVILGDFLHARTGRTRATLGALGAWRKRHAGLEIVLIQGNHDRRAGAPPDSWKLRCVHNPWPLPPFECRHEPVSVRGAHVLAGHVHPAFHLHERIGAGISGPCFHFSRRVALLPAFGSFTGSHPVSARRGERIFIAGDGEVIDVSAAVR
jgi:uncharacterized protein